MRIFRIKLNICSIRKNHGFSKSERFELFTGHESEEALLITAEGLKYLPQGLVCHGIFRHQHTYMVIGF